MASINFVIPSKLEDLTITSDNYFVRDVIGRKELLMKLKEARESFNDKGPEYILSNFDVFYSVLHEDTVPMNILFKSYQDLHAAVSDLSKAVTIQLKNKRNIDNELKEKYQNIIKMLIYIYTRTVSIIEEKNVETIQKQALIKGRKRLDKNDITFNLDKKSIVSVLNSIIQNEIGFFWDPPIVEADLINVIAEMSFLFLSNPDIKGDKDFIEKLFNLFGVLIQNYNLSSNFTIRITQMLKIKEHLSYFLSDGIHQLVQNYNCRGVVNALCTEIIESQTDNRFEDNQGSKFCAQFLTSLGKEMPNLMLKELTFLEKCLYHEPFTFRNSILNIITEVLIQVLNHDSLDTDKENERNCFFSTLMQHLRDNSPHVRSHVLQNLARLKQEVAIPKFLTNEILEHIVKYLLKDKSVFVRKNAVNCVSTFLSHNIYAAELSLMEMNSALQITSVLLESLRRKIEQPHENEEKWNQILPNLKKAVMKELQKTDDEDDEEEEKENDSDVSESADLIKCLSECRYGKVFKIWKKDFEDNEEIDETDELIMDKFLKDVKELFMKTKENIDGDNNEDFIISEENLENFQVVKEKNEFLSQAVEFLQIIDESIETMLELLETPHISDMQAAVAFFIAAYQFNIDNCEKGILAMLKTLKRNDPERREIVVSALKDIYLKTNTKNMTEHSTTIVTRLLRLLKTLSADDTENFETLIAEWVEKGALDISIIDRMWQYFCRTVSVTDDDCHGSVELLRMCAVKRRTIIERNVALVASIGFGEFGQRNMPFLGSCCHFLALAGSTRIDITSSTAPYKISADSNIFKNLFDILSANFFKHVEFYPALSGAIKFVYQVCGQPDRLCDQFIKEIYEKLEIPLDNHVAIHLCQLMGLVAINQLEFLDETVYKEIKRREHVHNTKTNKNNGKSSKKQNTTKTIDSTASSQVAKNLDESNMEGAEAEDKDAEFILQVLEYQIVTDSGLLAQLAPFIVKICEDPDTNEYLMGSAITALIRYMLVSSVFCKKQIRLLFTILEKTQYTKIKVSILYHLSDLLTKFPNVIEPWTPRIYERLQNESVDVRKATFHTLATLILKDMIRAHSCIHLMAKTLIDPDKDLVGKCSEFFINLAQKENNLYNALPDTFSHLMETENITDEHVKDIMKFLFERMDKSKHMENLVVRFCVKFKLNEDTRNHRHIAYCLSLINYNERALKKLLENFSEYKHLLHDPEIYASFKSIIQACKKQVGKTNLKTIIAELEQSISSIFELNKDAPRPSTSGRTHLDKPTKKRTTRRKNKERKQYTSESDSD